MSAEDLETPPTTLLGEDERGRQYIILEYARAAGEAASHSKTDQRQLSRSVSWTINGEEVQISVNRNRALLPDGTVLRIIGSNPERP